MKTPKHPVVGDQPARAGKVHPQVSRQRLGFTLLELLVVMVLMGVLGALLLPTLSRSKARAQAILCANNKKQLAFAWTMYSDDNDARLAYNLHPAPILFSGASLPNPNWVNNTMNWEVTPGNTNLDFATQSVIGEYTSRSASVYHCPADRAVSDVQRNAGWNGRVRSVSMNAMVGDPGNLMDGINLDNPGAQQFLRESDFRDPASVFVFLDEHPDSINDGYFLNNSINLEWMDLPGSYHNGGGSFSFADGHTEIHRWQSAATVVASVPDAFHGPMSISPKDRADYDWVIRHTSVSLK